MESLTSHDIGVAQAFLVDYISRNSGCSEKAACEYLALNSDYTYKDAQYVLWLLKGKGEIIGVNAGVGLNPFKDYSRFNYSFTTTRRLHF